MNHSQTRNPALDVIRSIALLCVICVHFFLNTDFYNITVSGKGMLIMSILRNSFMICVPLFIMLTGYLIQAKEANQIYYIKIIRIIYVYIAASIICGLFKIYVLKNNLSILRVIVNMSSFETAPYSWYIEMYIGFFLLIPFLNTMYDALYTQRKKILLVVTLLFLTASPSILNIYCISEPNWWLMPSMVSNYHPIVPDWWVNIYPITYFFLGKYLREYPPSASPKCIACLAILVFLFAGLFNYYRSYGNSFVWGPWQEYGSFLITLQTVLVFCFFIKLNYEKLTPFFRNVFSVISDLSLGAYLLSWVFDQIIYTKLNNSVSTMQQKLIYFPIVVTLVLVGSLLCSFLINLPYSYFIKKHIDRYTSRVTGNRNRCP